MWWVVASAEHQSTRSQTVQGGYVGGSYTAWCWMATTTADWEIRYVWNTCPTNRESGQSHKQRNKIIASNTDLYS